ncbi:telomere-associated protein Tap [Embleya sp. MST-111070]|uniref:telomere-associated protein Tap n=1 Tax=Embleya sp. MST-111070 TaxID=3398231 RepID=UPI003F7377E4
MRDETLFEAVDALLAQVAQGDLPPPAERSRLRTAAGLTQQRVADALGVRRDTIVSWEAGRTEPRPPQRQAYARLLRGLAERYPAPAATPDTAPTPEDPPAVSVADVEASPAARSAAAPWTRPSAAPAALPAVPADQAPAPAPAPGPARSGGPTAPRPPASRAPARSGRAARPATDTPAAAATASDADRFAAGPLAVLDRAPRGFVAHLTGGRTVPCPAKTLPDVVAWALAAGLGAPRLHRAGRDADPLVVVTAAAAERLGVPPDLEDRRNLRLPDDHKVVKQVTKDGWRLTRRGFAPWTKVYRPPAEGGRRECVQFAFLGWDALDARSWAGAATLPPGELADLLGAYAARVITPRGSTAVAGLTLMTEVRPPTQAVKDPTTGNWRSGPVPGSLTEAVDPAPPEAPDEHPVAQTRAAHEVLVEEAYDWHRPIHLIDDAEADREYAVGLDVNTAFLAAASRLPVGLGAPVHVEAPTFDPKLPGCWYVDLSTLDLDPRLPSPFTPTGIAPTGPGWYATPTVAYALELGASVDPFEAWIRPDHGPYLDPWYTRLRDAYLATMADLGVTPDLTDAAFLTAMEHHKQADPARAIVLSAIKATVKGGIGKLRERPQGAHYRPGDRWSALERPTWRPDIRAAVIANARIGMHRKIRKLAQAADLYPIAVLSDCVVYPATGPSPVDVLPRTPDGKPLPGAFRLGASPGMVKHEGTRPMMDILEMLAQGTNPARFIKPGTDAAAQGE